MGETNLRLVKKGRIEEEMFSFYFLGFEIEN